MKKLFKIDKSALSSDDSGILYLLVIKLDCGTEVYKVGVTKRKVEERVAEILTSFWVSYRYFPYCYPKRFKTTSNVYDKEACMHKDLKDYKYTFDKSFGGHTEFFSGIPLDVLLEKYESVINEKGAV